MSEAPNFSESEPRKYQGLVRFVVSYGAFVDVGTHLGLRHQTRISLEAIDCVNDVLYEGQQVRLVRLVTRYYLLVCLGGKGLIWSFHVSPGSCPSLTVVLPRRFVSGVGLCLAWSAA